MKKLMMIFGLVLALSSMSMAAFAVVDCFNAQGRAVVNGMRAYQVGTAGVGRTNIWVTNVSNQTVTCRITVYDHDGADVTYCSSLYTGTANSPNVTLIGHGIEEFNLPAHSSRVFTFGKSDMIDHYMGYAVIEWNSVDTALRRALLAQVNMVQRVNDSYHSTMVAVNGGEIF